MSDVLVSVLSALAVGGACLLGPQVIRRLPEPPPRDEVSADSADASAKGEPDAERPDGVASLPAPSEQDVAAVDFVRADSPMAGATDYVKIPYAELAARPHLALKLGLVGLVVGAVIGAALSDQPIIFAWLFLAVVSVWLGYVDAQTRLLPTRLIGPSYGVLIALIGLAALVDGETDDLIRAGLGWAVYGGFFHLMHIVYPRGLGYGDVRLAGLLGLVLGYLGWGELLVGAYAGLLLGGVIGGILALIKVVDRKRYPFGPFMLIGALVGLVAGGPFADWYTGV